jgi:2-polyprenyl-3-methyl-5-hydroxy-6-metoxy-1,4-benzoquinol methylase
MIRLFGFRYMLLTRDWLMHERARYLAHWSTRIPGQLRILDAGCGSALSLMYLHTYAAKVRRYVGIDLDTGRLRSRYRNSPIAHDFIDVDLDSAWQLGSFDLIFASEVIEHIVDDRRLFARLSQHLTENGILVVTTPNKSFVHQIAENLTGFDEVSAIQDGGHVRVGYSPSELVELAHENSLISIAESYLGKITLRELSKRQSLRKGADFATTARFNLTRFVRSALAPRGSNINPDQCWSLAIAFQKQSPEGTRSNLCQSSSPKAWLRIRR